MKFGPHRLFRYQSGRVIALGRLMLASLFLLSVWFDHTEPAPTHTYAVLLFYVLFSLGLTALTWRNWWLDARLAAFAHLIDMAVFTGIIFSTNGYTSPFFLFFILPLLSAAIRWGWRETALTAIALVLLYLAAGLLVTGSTRFEVQRFITRSGHLITLSALLIWFGVHQQLARLFLSVGQGDQRAGRDEGPLAQALIFAVEIAGARCGALVLADEESRQYSGIRIRDERIRPVRTAVGLVAEPLPVLLFDLERDRALARLPNGRRGFAAASRLVDSATLIELGAREGLAAQIEAGASAGWLLLWDLDDLSADYLDLGLEIARAVGAALDHEALLVATEEGAAARTRLSLARDVHDNIVQFLAGAAFRVEAIKRGAAGDSAMRSDLEELKRLLVEEQGELRAFVSALRSDSELDFEESVDELRALAARLAQQWSIECSVAARDQQETVPIRVQLDLQQLVREAIANAVRHGSCSRVDIDLEVEEGQLRMEIIDNGSGMAMASNGSPVQPWSLKERVERANGSLLLVSQPGRTTIVINLPLAGVAT